MNKLIGSGRYDTLLNENIKSRLALENLDRKKLLSEYLFYQLNYDPRFSNLKDRFIRDKNKIKNPNNDDINYQNLFDERQRQFSNRRDNSPPSMIDAFDPSIISGFHTPKYLSPRSNITRNSQVSLRTPQSHPQSQKSETPRTNKSLSLSNVTRNSQVSFQTSQSRKSDIPKQMISKKIKKSEPSIKTVKAKLSEFDDEEIAELIDVNLPKESKKKYVNGAKELIPRKELIETLISSGDYKKLKLKF